MTIDPIRWVNTIPGQNRELNSEKYKIDQEKWINTLPKKNMNNTVKKYSLTLILFFVGLIFVSTLKNQTRSLQKEMGNLEASINSLKLDLHQTTLEYEVINSPENISRLAKEHLEFDFISYKKSQIQSLNQKIIISSKIKRNEKVKILPESIKYQIAKNIEQKKLKVKKMQQLYTKPETIPDEIRTQVVKEIKKKRKQIKKIYNSPGDIITLEKAKKWGAIQVVKAFFGIPIIPGR